jgi:soluble lytic murein transglycosylase-like protein
MFNTNRQNAKKIRNWTAHAAVAAISAVILTFGIAPGAVFATDVYMFRGEQGEAYYTNVSGQNRVKVRLPVYKPEMKKRQSAMPAEPRPFAISHNIGVYEPIIAQASQIFSVDSDIVRAVIKAESNYNTRAVSPKGALGLMQLMPKTARELGVADPFDPVDNIHGGVRYLSQLLDVLNDNLPLALAAYNAGPLRVMAQRRIPAIPETRQYVDRVLSYYQSFKVKDEK